VPRIFPIVFHAVLRAGPKSALVFPSIENGTFGKIMADKPETKSKEAGAIVTAAKRQ
jgi:hypothetical protein